MLSNRTSTILVLEPDAVVRSAICEFLRDCGYLVIEGVAAADLHAALHANAIIDVVLAEVLLTGSTSGFELAHGLRQTRPEIAVNFGFKHRQRGRKSERPVWPQSLEEALQPR